MRLCLASLLARAVDEKEGAIGGDDAAFLAWVDRYAAQTARLRFRGTPDCNESAALCTATAWIPHCR